ncbi:MAG: hypothetical protein JF603_03090 [Acidobacteria bacterium]|nr:hypothetical protein [Acidobacteriota bacterium]
MTITARGFELDDNQVVELSFRKPPLSEWNHKPFRLYIGDDDRGPGVGLFFDAPSTPEEMAAPIDLTPAHGHVCDNFRIVMKGELWVGRERYHHGEFRIQRSARPYGADGDAPHPEGNWRIIAFADRRGARTRPTKPELRAQVENDEAIQKQREATGFDILPPNDPGINGLVTTLDKPWSKVQHIDASVHDAGEWPAIGDGGRVCVNLLADHEVGPIFIVQRTPAGAMATPRMTVGSDVFRCVISGSYRREDGEIVEMGDGRAHAPGVPWEAVTAGPDGLDEIIIIGDRSGRQATVEGPDNGWAERIEELVQTLLPGLADLKQFNVRPFVDDTDRPELHLVEP